MFFCFLGKWDSKKRGAIAHVPSIFFIPSFYPIPSATRDLVHRRKGKTHYPIFICLSKSF
jgi:hypothetical protein